MCSRWLTDLQSTDWTELLYCLYWMGTAVKGNQSQVTLQTIRNRKRRPPPPTLPPETRKDKNEEARLCRREPVKGSGGESEQAVEDLTDCCIRVAHKWASGINRTIGNSVCCYLLFLPLLWFALLWFTLPFLGLFVAFFRHCYYRYQSNNIGTAIGTETGTATCAMQ